MAQIDPVILAYMVNPDHGNPAPTD